MIWNCRSIWMILVSHWIYALFFNRPMRTREQYTRKLSRLSERKSHFVFLFSFNLHMCIFGSQSLCRLLYYRHKLIFHSHEVFISIIYSNIIPIKNLKWSQPQKIKAPSSKQTLNHGNNTMDQAKKEKINQNDRNTTILPFPSNHNTTAANNNIHVLW